MELTNWTVSGSYYEVCNCEAICPCRRQGGQKGGKATYDTCDFALSWWIKDGQAGGIDLQGLKVVMTGTFARENADLWSVVLYLDELATPEQGAALTALFLGPAGGTNTTALPFSAWIGKVHAIKRGRIELDHTPNVERIDVQPYLTVKTREPVAQESTVSCGIPGHQFPGQEIRTEVVRYQDGPFDWEFRGKCGFATRFSYASPA
jgi:hypothetical protein